MSDHQSTDVEMLKLSSALKESFGRVRDESYRLGYDRGVLEGHIDRDAAKKTVCDYLVGVNESMEGPFIPPTAIDWIGNGLVDALYSVTC